MPRGRPFQPGCKPGPGRPPRSQRSKDYAAAARQAITPRILARILRRLAKRALTGTVDHLAVKCAETVIKASLGGDPAAALDMAERLEALEERHREREERQESVAQVWTPRHLTSEDNDRNGEGDHRDGDGAGPDGDRDPVARALAAEVTGPRLF